MDKQADLPRRMLLALAVAPLALPGAACATPTESLPADLAEALAAYDRATFSNDIPALREIVADDYMLVNSDASLQDKASYLADFAAPGFRMEPYVMQAPVAKVWNDVALTGGLMPLAWTQDGVGHSRMLRIAHVWVRGGGRWRIAYTQLTRVLQA
jgi:ketosteroid isomerase-like protein